MKKKRSLALLLLVAFCISIVFSAAFIVGHAAHDCPGEHCETCLEIDACLTLLHPAIPAALSAAVILCGTYLPYLLRPLHAVQRMETLISLKVKLSN